MIAHAIAVSGQSYGGDGKTSFIDIKETIQLQPGSRIDTRFIKIEMDDHPLFLLRPESGVEKKD
jgi:hypothetical protein